MKKIISIAVVAVVVLLFVVGNVTIMPTGYTGVLISFGQVEEEVVTAGSVRVTIPFVQSIEKINNKQQDVTYEGEIWGETSDKTPVYASAVTATYQILPEKSSWIVANLNDTNNLVNSSLISSAVKSAMGLYAPSEVTVRTIIEPAIQEQLQLSVNQKYGEDVVLINKVVVNNMDFKEAYNDAIQQKSIAQQTAERQRIENETAIAKAEADKQVAITNAQAEAEKTAIEAEAQANANAKISESLSDELIAYLEIEKWDGSLPSVVGSDEVVPVINSSN